MDRNKHNRNSNDQNGIGDANTNDVLTQIIQLKNEMRTNLGDVLAQMNQMRVEMRGSLGDIQSQLNLVRSEMKAFTNDIRNLPEQVSQAKTENSETTSKLLEQNQRLQSENEHLRQLLHRDSSDALMAAYPPQLYAHHHQMQMAIYEESENSIHDSKSPVEEAQEETEQPQPPPQTQKSQRKRHMEMSNSSNKKANNIKKVEENGNADSNDMVRIGEHVMLPKELYDTFKDESRLPYLRKLLDLVFGKDILATHTLGGRADRPALNEEFANDIISHTVQKFKVDQSVVKKAISDRCFFERKRAGKQNTTI